MNIKLKLVYCLIIVIIIIILVYLYARFIGTKGLKIKDYSLSNEYFIENFNGYTIAHISDIHYGNHLPKDKLKTLVEKINNINPDLIVLTGDLVDDKISETEHNEIVEELSKLKAKYGKYSVNGNHDKRYDNYNKLIEDIKFIDLNDKYEKIYLEKDKYIFLAGISDSICTKINIKDRSQLIFDELNNMDEKQITKILLIHEPDEIEKIDYSKFDFIFAGHSHNGQVRIPFVGSIYEPIGSKKYYDEYYKLNNTDLYISSGIGMSWLPIRLFNKPSFNVYRLEKK